MHPVKGNIKESISAIDAMINEYLKSLDVISSHLISDLIHHFASPLEYAGCSIRDIIAIESKHDLLDPSTIEDTWYPAGSLEASIYDTYDSYTKIAILWQLFQKFYYGKESCRTIITNYFKPSVTFPSAMDYILMIQNFPKEKFSDDSMITSIKGYESYNRIIVPTEYVSVGIGKISIQNINNYLYDKLLHEFRDVDVEHIGKDALEFSINEICKQVFIEVHTAQSNGNSCQYFMNPMDKVFFQYAYPYGDTIWICRPSLFKELMKNCK